MAFGSCYGIFSHTSDIFETIAEERPDLFVWLGDVAYVDNPRHFGPMPPEYIHERFELTKNAAGYSKLLERSKVIGVWDDHDFGTNDGGKNFPFRDQNREFWLDFIDEPSDSERRTQRGSPIHQDYIIKKGEQVIQVILLDNRYEADVDSSGASGDYLGAE